MAFPSLNFLVSFPISSIYLNNSLSLAFGVIAIIVVSPISEELIFRGVMLNRMNLFVPTKFAIVITSLLFAALHSFGSITSAFIFAFCMAILYLKTDNIFVPMFAHFLNNLLAESIVAFDSQNLLFTNSILIYSVSILAIISFVIIFISISRQWNNINNNQS
ncbi:CPBP family intramembrane glutamic endopeptidase [Methanobrevibacter sp.]|uniref:CPBP family intramembrane glutamic endopeptidase n=1 Tax=Methanobrevibacter sp. TaxID=66852 RepID=UPI00388EB16E